MGLPDSEMGWSNQSLMFFRIVVQVPLKQQSGAFDCPELYLAPLVQGSLLNSLAMDFFYTNSRLHHIVRRQSRHLQIVEPFGGHLQMPVKCFSLSMLIRGVCHTCDSSTLRIRVGPNAHTHDSSTPCIHIGPNAGPNTS